MDYGRRDKVAMEERMETEKRAAYGRDRGNDGMQGRNKTGFDIERD